MEDRTATESDISLLEKFKYSKEELTISSVHGGFQELPRRHCVCYTRFPYKPETHNWIPLQHF